MVMPIVITSIVFLVIALGVIAVWLIKKINIRRVQKELAEYTALGTSTGI